MAGLAEQQAARGKSNPTPQAGEETIDALMGGGEGGGGGGGGGGRGKISIVRCCTREEAPQCHLFCEGAHIYLPLPLKIMSSTSTAWNSLSSGEGMIHSTLMGLANGDQGIMDTWQTARGGLGNLWREKWSAIAGFTGPNGAAWALAKAGIATLPAKELTFDGIDFRSFQFQWSLVPLSKKDSDNVHKMIKKVQEHMLPAFASGVVGYPDLWAINWKDGRSGDTKALPIIKDSYVSKIDIDYSAAGGYTHVHEQCEPVAFLVSITFNEATLFTREDVKAEIYG